MSNSKPKTVTHLFLKKIISHNQLKYKQHGPTVEEKSWCNYSIFIVFFKLVLSDIASSMYVLLVISYALLQNK